MVESNVILVAASIPTLKPIYRKLRGMEVMESKNVSDGPDVIQPPKRRVRSPYEDSVLNPTIINRDSVLTDNSRGNRQSRRSTMGIGGMV